MFEVEFASDRFIVDDRGVAVNLDEAIEVPGYIMNSKSKEEVISKCKGLYRE